MEGCERTESCAPDTMTEAEVIVGPENATASWQFREAKREGLEGGIASAHCQLGVTIVDTLGV